MQDDEANALNAAIAALQGQRTTLGDAVLELALAPLRARLASLQRAPSLQRRQVTVLFADVVGSTAMASALDAEDTLHLLSGTLQRMAAIVQAHQGRVLRYTGDGLKAAFGMDEAREDDAERAVRAGLAILEAAREQAAAAARLPGNPSLAVRVGVHTGDVALGAGVEDANTAMGATVNIAARMEQSAPPGALRISHDSWSQVRGLFDAQPQPPLQVKGVDVPMQTYLVRAALDRGSARVERGLQGLRTPLVGRKAELDSLRALLAAARERRCLQALTLVGEAGLGKSRLVAELRADVRDGQLIAVRARPDGLLRPWGLLHALVALQCGVADTDSARLAGEKVVAGLGPWFEERGERQAQLIGQLSGLDYGDSPHVRGLDPRMLRDQALAALRGYLQALAAPPRALPVLLVEDLHWADDSSLDLLQHLLDHAAELPLALVMTGRPALLTRRPGWGAPGAVLPLRPLGAAQGDELAQALLQRLGTVPARLVELVVGQAEGNPYYMEELVRRLVDDGAIAVDGERWTLREEQLDRLRLPGTLVGLLQARLDALPAPERRTARQASIIGHVFWDDALRSLDGEAPRSLPALERAAFVRTQATSEVEGTRQRQFDHHLLHQVTYDTLLKAERRLGHGAAARWLAARTQGRGAEFLAMTAEHAERAGETSLAVDSFEQAATEAQKRYANAAALSYCRRALALLGDADPGRSMDLLSDMDKIADTLGDRAAQEEASRETEALLLRHPDDARQARLWWSQALLADRRGDTAASERLARQAGELAERCGAARWAAMAHGQLAWLHIARQDYGGAGHHIGLGLPWAGQIRSDFVRAETEAQLLTLSGMVSVLCGRMAQARITLTEVLARGELLGTPRLQLGALDNLALVDSHLGRWDEVAGWGARMLALARTIGSRGDVAGAQLRLAKAALGRGDEAAAAALFEQNLAIYRATGNRRLEAITLRMLATLQLARGEVQAAASGCAQALDLHASLSEPCAACEAAATAALCAARLGQCEQAQARLDEVMRRLAELADYPAGETIELRWICHQAMVALGDARARALLERLAADVHARAAELTDEADRARLIGAQPEFMAILQALGRLGAAGRAQP